MRDIESQCLQWLHVHVLTFVLSITPKSRFIVSVL